MNDLPRIDELGVARLNDFARRLARQPRRTVDRRTLWAAFAKAFPGRPQGIDEHRWLLVALQELQRRELIQLPSERGKRWDRSGPIAVPTSVDLVRPKSERNERQWTDFPWHPALHWVADLRTLTSENEAFLRNVHQGLVNGLFATPAPLKYRSLQLTGDEKRLASLMKTRLFGNGRLGLDLLGCYRESPPLAVTDVSPLPSIIIFENAGPFTVARGVLEELPAPPYGMVGYGGGRTVTASIAYLRSLSRPVERVFYVGDLDWEGLAIACALQKEARKMGLPIPEPAPGIHELMLTVAGRFGHPTGWPCPQRSYRGPDKSDTSLRFLPTALQCPVNRILSQGRRVPEEVLGPGELCSVWQGGV